MKIWSAVGSPEGLGDLSTGADGTGEEVGRSVVTVAVTLESSLAGAFDAAGAA